jgi:hypothetical protein
MTRGDQEEEEEEEEMEERAGEDNEVSALCG